MTVRERAVIWWKDPRVQSLVVEGLKEAKRLGKGWCFNKFMYSRPGPNGNVGVVHLLESFLPKLDPGGALSPRIDGQMILFLRYGFERALPDCRHTDRNGQPSCCITNYPCYLIPSKPGREVLRRESASRKGFFSLIDALQNGGK